MARRVLTASLVLSPFAAALAMQGCTQDFGTFDPTGSGGGDPTTTTASSSPTVVSSSSSSSTGSPTTTTTTTNVGPGGGGEGGFGGAGPGNGGGGADQGGGGIGPTDCTEATAAEDCDDDNVCTDDSCDEGTCVNTAVADGPLDGDDPTDCVDLSCAGGRLVQTADDSEDPPDTSPPCDVSNCVEGEVVQVLAEQGTSCGANPLVCDGAGVCSGCDGIPGNECGNPTDCSDPSCDTTDGTCDPGFTSDTPDDPTDGDCKALECPGDAADATVVNDDTDLPDDLPCSDRGCNNGSITSPVRNEGLDCLVGTGVCDGIGTQAANCKVCRDTMGGTATDAGCNGGTPICVEAGDGACKLCIDDVPDDGQDTGCGANLVCNPAGDGTCVTCYGSGGTSVGCDAGETCDGGTCVVCADDGNGVIDSGCAAPTLACDERATPVCVECRNNADCVISGEENPNGPDCSQNSDTQCGCDNDNDCSGNDQGHDCIQDVGAYDFCGCNMDNDCNGITGETGCLNSVCMCGAEPCVP